MPRYRQRQLRLTHQQRCVLKMLAGQSYNAVDELFVLANGVDIEALAGLIRDGLATTWPETVEADHGSIEVVRIAITDAGQNALGADRA